MARLSLDEVASAVAGRRIRGAGDSVVSRYAIDSRKVGGGELFFALRGPKHDGHDFLAEAFERGASAAVVSRPDIAAPADRGIVLAEDTTHALQQLAATLRRKKTPQVVGVTGSSGKTTTKEMTAAALGTAWKVHRSGGNLNNTFGMPLTMLQMADDTEVLVLEMGMSYPGEIARLAEIADPDVGAILNVSEVHREHFSSIDSIANAKEELWRGMRVGTTAVFNAADPRVASRAASFPGRRVSFAVDAPADVSATDVRDDMVEGVRFLLSTPAANDRAPISMTLGLYGKHNAANAAGAIAVAFSMGLDVARAAQAVASMRPVEGRGVVERLGREVVLVDETYNCNPAAMRAVLASMRSTRWSGRRVLAFGDMLEIGEDAAQRHREIGELAARSGVGLLLAVGPLAFETASGAAAGGLSATEVYADSAEAARQAPLLIRPGDLVVVKGSRGIAMEKVTDSLRAALGEAA